MKRTSCVYDVYRKREFNPTQVVDTTDVMCINCMRCVQECKKNILERVRNPQYDRMGDSYWRPDLIASWLGIPHDQRYWTYLIGMAVFGILYLMQRPRIAKDTVAAPAF